MQPKLLTADRFVNLKTGCSYRYIHSSTEYFRPHFHDYYEIFIVLSGKVLHIANGERIAMERGDSAFIRPSDIHDYICCGEDEVHMLNITFTESTAEGIFSFLGDGFNTDALFKEKDPPAVSLSEYELNNISKRMTDICVIDESDTEKLKTALRIFLFNFISEYFSRTLRYSKTAAPRWLTSLCERMKKDGNFISGISLMPELSGKSREHISRSMKKYYGISATEFVNDLRLSYIANMLQNSDHSIIDIIYESGFNNVSWCNRCFVKKFGMNMSTYRRLVTTERSRNELQ